MNPYWGNTFFEFFGTLFSRLGEMVRGNLAPDEIQIAVLCAVAVSCGLIGPFLVLKRMAMFANSLSHTILLGIAGAYLIASAFWGGSMFDLSTLLLGALVAAIVTALLTEGLIRFFRLQEDASVGLVFTALFALGITAVTLFTRDLHIGIEAVMGNADVLQMKDLKTAALLAGINLGAVFLFYRHFQLASFDRSLAQTLGIRSGLFHFFLLLLAAITCIGAFRAVGVLLVLAFLTGPFLIARRFSHRLRPLLFWSVALGIFASIIGVALSRHVLSAYGLPLSTGGLVVVLIGIIYAVSAKLSHLIGKVKWSKRSPS